MRNVAPTAIESFLGFFVGNLASIVIATIFVHQKTVEQAFFPLAIIIRSIPIVAVAPILVLMLGNDMTPKVVIAALICFFPTLVNMVKGLSLVNPQALELMKVLSASKSEIFFKLQALQLASLPLRRPQDRRERLGHRRHRRRVDREHRRDRRSHHPGDLQLRHRASLRGHHRGRYLLGALHGTHLLGSSAAW